MSSRISVKIPVYNCAEFLERALQSVLEQEVDPDLIDIEVIDDASNDSPEAVVRLFDSSRVKYYRKPINEGLTANFNTCVERSCGDLVHILHGDDFVNVGFYRSVLDAFERCPDVALYCCACQIVEEKARYLRVDTIPLLRRSGSYDGFYHLLVPNNPVRTPTVVIPRWVYGSVGGFDVRLSHSTDWNMWLKASSCGPVYFETRPLASYRQSSSNASAGHMRTGRYLAEYYWARMLWIEERQPRNAAEYRDKTRQDILRRVVRDLEMHGLEKDRARLLLDLFEEEMPELLDEASRAIRSKMPRRRWREALSMRTPRQGEECRLSSGATP